MPVASLLTTLQDMEGSPTIISNNTRYGGGQGGSANTDVFIEGLQSVGRRADNQTNQGVGVQTPTSDLSAAGTHAKHWISVLQWPLVTQLQVILASGSGAAAGDIHTVPLSQFPELGGFIPVWFDVSRAPEEGGPSTKTAINECGMRVNIGNVGGNAQNIINDAVNYGSSGLRWTGTGGDFTEFADFDSTNREGVVIENNGTIFNFARLEIGDGVVATDFLSENEKITDVDQSLVAFDFMGQTFTNTRAGDSFEINGSTLDSSNVVGAAVRGDFIVNGNANPFPITNAVIDGKRIIQLTDSVTVTGGTLGGIEFTQGGATLDGVTLRPNTALNVAWVDDLTLADLTNIRVLQTGSGHFANLGTIAASQSINWAINATGFPLGTAGDPATTTSNGDETILVNVASGQKLTINLAAGVPVPSVKNDGPGEVAIVVPEITITFTQLVVGGEFRVYDDDGDGNPITIGTERAGIENLVGTTFAITHSAAEAGNIIYAQFMEPADFEEEVIEVTLSTVDQTIPFNLQPEENV